MAIYKVENFFQNCNYYKSIITYINNCEFFYNLERISFRLIWQRYDNGTETSDRKNYDSFNENTQSFQKSDDAKFMIRENSIFTWLWFFAVLCTYRWSFFVCNLTIIRCVFARLRYLRTRQLIWYEYVTDRDQIRENDYYKFA